MNKRDENKIWKILAIGFVISQLLMFFGKYLQNKQPKQEPIYFEYQELYYYD